MCLIFIHHRQEVTHDTTGRFCWAGDYGQTAGIARFKQWQPCAGRQWVKHRSVNCSRHDAAMFAPNLALWEWYSVSRWYPSVTGGHT